MVTLPTKSNLNFDLKERLDKIDYNMKCLDLIEKLKALDRIAKFTNVWILDTLGQKINNMATRKTEKGCKLNCSIDKYEVHLNS